MALQSLAIASLMIGGIGGAGCYTPANVGGTKDGRLGSLVPGSSCVQSSACSSGLCLGQYCCALPDCGTDATCQGTGCDSTGACLYPSGSCAPACAEAQLTPGTCALGACVAGVPSACPRNLTCATPTSCRVSCGQASDCTAGFYCSSGSCLPQLDAGTDCTSNDSCATGICGVNGSGHCCTAACPLAGPLGCGATDCDTAGSCVFPPATTACDTQSCAHATLTSRTCDGAGACAPATATACPNSLGCNLAGTACNQTCSLKSDCADGNYCAAGSCLPQIVVGACTTADACTSGVCGLNGAGSCCATSCNGGTGTCGPSGCDVGTGECIYTASGTPCVAAGPGGTCDGTGFCASGPVYFVNSWKGHDKATCGAQASPCRSMTQAMSLVAAAGISGATLEVLSTATTSPDSWAWPTGIEKWPIHLGLGVTVRIREMSVDAPANSDVFDVFAYDANDTGTVTLVGYDSGASIGIYSGLIGINDNVPNQTALPLVLGQIGINGAFQALSVGPGAQVTLGPGPVSIGAVGAPGPTGIYCRGSAANPASLTDDAIVFAPFIMGLLINNHTTDIDAEDYCTISLTHAPQLGAEEWAEGETHCHEDPDTTGIVAVGNASVTFGSNAAPVAASHIWCLAGNAIDMETSNASGSPTVTLVNTIVQYNGCAGALVNVGTFTATNSSFIGNHFGIQQGGGSVDVSGGGMGASTFECSDSSQIGICNGDGIPAMDFLNTTSGTTLTADNALVDSAIDGGAPEMWSCSDTTYGSCTCTGSPNCPAAAQALPEGADFVSLSGNSTPFSVTNVAGNGSGCP